MFAGGPCGGEKEKQHMGFICQVQGKKIIKTFNITQKNSQHLATDCCG